MNKEQVKKEIADMTKDLLVGIKMIRVAVEMEKPGCGDLVIDVLIEEIDKLRSKPREPEQGETVSSEQANELMRTVDMMGSADYKERFKAEYYQTKIRYDKLDSMTVKYEAGTLDFTPSCELALLKEQKAAMGNYLRCLKIRAEIEGVTL